mmetsp:Transcript_28584/g.91096  ORF Transcript_28584/g.91096 Transcript_28584/m.91096 type:complete len:202 (+) Transcript_28584:297-902(+)
MPGGARRVQWCPSGPLRHLLRQHPRDQAGGGGGVSRPGRRQGRAHASGGGARPPKGVQPVPACAAQLQGKEEVSGLYAKPGCTEEQQTEARGKLRAACVALAAASERVMLGVCGPTQGAGVDALKGWVPALGLPKGRLHGMDKAGVPIDMAGAVFIKYNSISGDADLSGYGGLYRGVLFTPQLPDGEFRQYGYLPLGLFQP